MLPISVFQVYILQADLGVNMFPRRQIFNYHLVDLYAEYVRTIRQKPSSILKETSNTPGGSNFKVPYSSMY